MFRKLTSLTFALSLIFTHPLTLSAQIVTVSPSSGPHVNVQAIPRYNLPPVINNYADIALDVGSSVTRQLLATDPNNDPITFMIEPIPLPTNMSLDSHSGIFKFTPAASQEGQNFFIKVIASDGILTDDDTFTVTVNPISAGNTTKISGVVLDASEAFLGNAPYPLVGAKISLMGDPNNFVLTDVEGKFTLDNVLPDVQVIDVNTFGVIGPNGVAYGGFREEIHLIEHVDNIVTHPFYMPQIDVSSLTMITPGQPAVVDNPNLNITLDVASNNAIDDATGQPFSGMMSISEVPPGFGPAEMPSFLNPGLLITIQPVGVSYATPAPISFQNDEGYAVGTHLDLWSLDAGTGQFVVVGTLEAMPNGMLETIAGGIRNNDWHLTLPPGVDANANSLAGENKDIDKCENTECSGWGSDVVISSGNLMEEHSLVSYRSFNHPQNLKLVYNSTTADPRHVLSTVATIPVLSTVPNSISTELTVGSISQGVPVFHSTAGLGEDQDESIYLSHQFDARMYPTGRYPYQWTIKNNFSSSAISTILNSNILINNQTNSPFGAGWSLAELQKIQTNSDSSVVLLHGDGSIAYFKPDFPDVLQNGSFEQGTLNPGTFVQLNLGSTVMTGWLVSLGSVDYIGSYWQTADGARSVDMNGVSIGRIEQTISTQPNKDYKVTFSMAGNVVLGPTIKMMRVSADTQFQDYAFDITGHSVASMGWEDMEFIFTATGSSTNLKFESLLPGANGPALDNVKVSALASPIGALDYKSPSGDYSTLKRNNDNTFTRTMKDGTVYNFDVNGLQTSMVDRNGNTTTYGYNGQNQLTTISVPASAAINFTTTLSYGADGKVDAITDPFGRTTQLHHDTNGDLIKITDPDLTERAFIYDNHHRIKTKIDKRDLETHYDYGFHGRNIQVNRPDNSTRKLIPVETLGLANLSAGVGTSQSPIPVIRPNEAVSTYFDGFDKMTVYETNGFGATTKITDALNRETFTIRDDDSNPTKITLPNTAVIDMTYDEKGNLLTVVENAIAATTTLTYTSEFNLVDTVTDAKNHVADIDYDINGNPVTVTDDAGTAFKLEYTDANCPGLVTKIISAQGLPEETQTRLEYYAGDCNLRKFIDPLNRETALTYDTHKNIQTITDGELKVTTLTHDHMNRLRQARDADMKDTFYDYDDAGNLTAVTDANAHTTLFSYDEMNRVETTTDPLLKVETYTYDANGNLDTIIDRKNQIIDFNYDDVNRLIKKEMPDPFGGANWIISYTYNLLDRLDTVTDPDSMIDFDYDLAGRLTRASTAGSPLQPDTTLEYVLDKVGNRDLMREQIASGPFVNTDYVFDNLNQIDTITNPSGSLIDIGHDALYRRYSLNYPNGTTIDYTHDVASQLSAISHQLSAIPFSQYDYTIYDGVGNRTAVSVQRPSVSNIMSPLNYVYDNLYRLDTATHPLQANPGEDFDYDNVGNRLRKQGQATDSVFDAANRLINDTLYTYTYDDNGNLTQKTLITQPTQQTLYMYDAMNQLVRIDAPNGDQFNYFYDGLGRRIAKKRNAILLKQYIYDDEDILFEFNGSDVLQARYTHGIGIDEPLIMERDLDISGSFDPSEQFFYHTDGLGSIVDLTNNTGVIAQSYVYDSFGNIIQQTGSMINPYTYTGREHDTESGLYYYRARYYDPTIGRFMQEDPIGFAGGDINLYNYVGNNGVNFIDPTGESLLQAGAWLLLGVQGYNMYATYANFSNGYYQNPYTGEWEAPIDFKGPSHPEKSNVCIPDNPTDGPEFWPAPPQKAVPQFLPTFPIDFQGARGGFTIPKPKGKYSYPASKPPWKYNNP